MVVSAGPGPYYSSWLARGSTECWKVVFPDRVPGGKTIDVGESIAGLDSSSRTPQWRTLELVVRIGCRPMHVLVDSFLTSNYIDAQECPTRGIKIEPEELKMADGTMAKTKGRV